MVTFLHFDPKQKSGIKKTKKHNFISKAAIKTGHDSPLLRTQHHAYSNRLNQYQNSLALLGTLAAL